MIAKFDEIQASCISGMKKFKAEKKKLEDEQRRRMQEFMKKNQEERMKAMKVCNDTMRMFSGDDARPGCNGRQKK